MSSRLVLAVLSVGLLAAPALGEGYQRYLPADTKAVYVFNVTALNDEEKKTGTELVRQLYATQLVPELKKLDKLPLNDLKQVIISQPFAGSVNLVNLTPSGAAAIVLLRGKVDAALLNKQMREAAKLSKGALKVESLGKPAASVYSRAVDEKQLKTTLPAFDLLPAQQRSFVVPKTVHMAALDGETLIVSFMGRPAIERALRARPAKAKARVSDEMKKLLDGLDDKDAVSVALTEGSDGLYPGLQLVAPKELLDWFAPVNATVARLRVGKTMKLTLTATCKSKDDAEKVEKATTKAAKTIIDSLPDGLKEEQRKVIKSLVESLKVSRKDAVVAATGQLSEDDLKKLLPEEKKKSSDK
jgi:hypothetical protein